MICNPTPLFPQFQFCWLGKYLSPYLISIDIKVVFFTLLLYPAVIRGHVFLTGPQKKGLDRRNSQWGAMWQGDCGALGKLAISHVYDEELHVERGDTLGLLWFLHVYVEKSIGEGVSMGLL